MCSGSSTTDRSSADMQDPQLICEPRPRDSISRSNFGPVEDEEPLEDEEHVDIKNRDKDVGPTAAGVPWPPSQYTFVPDDMMSCGPTYDLEVSEPNSPNTVKVIVGTKATRTAIFCLQQEELRSKSLFFQKALNKEARLIESQSQVVTLDQDPALFAMFARWISAGAPILTQEDDWKAEYTKYINWHLKLEEYNKYTTQPKLLYPDHVWDFALTMKAWLLGDYLAAPDFQNHCLGYMYYMNLCYDYLTLDPNYRENDLDQDTWHWGTIAYLDMDDIVLAWECTSTGTEEQEPSEPEIQHPLRLFISHFLTRYWDTYHPAWFDTIARAGRQRLNNACPDLADILLDGLSMPRHKRMKCMLSVGDYWVHPMETQEREALYYRAKGEGTQHHQQESNIYEYDECDPQRACDVRVRHRR